MLKLLILLVLLVSEAKLDKTPRCPTNDVFFPDDQKCYSFQEYRTSRLSFDQASTLCSKLGSGKRLASVATPKQSVFVAAEMKKLGWSKMAMSARYLQSAWKWASDDTLLRGQGCYRMTDKISIQASDMNVARCTESCGNQLFASLQGGRFCLCSSEEFTWPLPSNECTLWCPGVKNDSCGGLFSRYTYATAEDVYDNWARGRPTLGGECAALTIDHKANQWVDTSCNLALPFMCKFSKGKENRVKTPVIAERVACSQTICYHLYTNPQMTWFDADKFCGKYGGRLAKIEGADRQEFINTMLYDLNRPRLTSGNKRAQEQADHQRQPIGQAWIGATNHAWYDFTDNNATISGTHRFWVTPGQPEMPDANACTVFSVSASSGSWQTANCNASIDGGRFLCVSDALN